MKPAQFEYLRASSPDEALSVLRTDEDAKLLAGGQSLLPMMNLRLARPTVLVDLGGLGELRRVSEVSGVIDVGPLCSHRTVEMSPLFRSHLPLLSEAARHIGHVGIRNRGTLAGSLAHADPAAEMPLVAMTLGAEVVVRSLDRGTRVVPAEGFFESFFQTDLAPDELIGSVRFPAQPASQGWGFCEHARRPGDFALAGAAVTLDLSSEGTVRSLRCAVMSAARPVLVATGGELAGASPTAALFDELSLRWSQAAEAATDQEYRRALTRSALRRSLEHAHRRALVGELERG
ncbi:MAG: carbon monoxide dehydrogenase [Blastococcus sp.]|nr:carbon monoxide dehydrogenase [Blastococcus sp.]